VASAATLSVPLDFTSLGTCDETDLSSETLIPGVAVRLAALLPPPPPPVLLLELELLDPHPAASAVAAATQIAAVSLVRVPLIPLLLKS